MFSAYMGREAIRLCLILEITGLLCVLVGCANPEAGPDEEIKLDLVEEVVLDSLQLVRSAQTIDGEDLFVVDSENRNVKKYDLATGRLEAVMGRGGRAPGEFTTPLSLAVNDSLIAVGDVNGRITLMSHEGTYVSSFIASGVRHMNSDLAFVRDSLILVGGYREGGAPYEGKNVHVYDWEGENLNSLLPLGKTARRLEILMTSGASFDVHEDRVYAAQPTEETVYVLPIASGDAVTSTKASFEEKKVGLDDYRPVESRLDVQNPGSASIEEWLAGWDKLVGVHATNDSLLVVNRRMEKGRRRIDIVDASTFEQVAGFESEGRLSHVSDNGTLFVFDPIASRPAYTLKTYRVVKTP